MGPVRAVARLAVVYGALDYGQREGESFDDAVERARTNLLLATRAAGSLSHSNSTIEAPPSARQRGEYDAAAIIGFPCMPSQTRYVVIAGSASPSVSAEKGRLHLELWKHEDVWET